MAREKHFEAIMNSVATGVITFNDAGSVFQVNREALRILGMPRLTHLNQLRVVDPLLSDALGAIRPGERRQVPFRNEFGEVRLTLSAAGMSGESTPLRIVAVADIDNEMNERELESWSRLMRVLVHEIMNSLAPITSLSQTLLDDSVTREQLCAGLGTINATSRHLLTFVHSYRELTRIPPPEKHPFLIGPLLERSLALQTASAPRSTTLSVEPADTMVYADEGQIRQVVDNIVKNAVQATEGVEQGWIAIGVRIDEQENVVVEIANNGGEIDAEAASNIFMPFYTTKDGGTGIGLSVSRQIMHLHGGSIKLSSNSAQRVAFTLLFG